MRLFVLPQIPLSCLSCVCACPYLRLCPLYNIATNPHIFHAISAVTQSYGRMNLELQRTLCVCLNVWIFLFYLISGHQHGLIIVRAQKLCLMFLSSSYGAEYAQICQPIMVVNRVATAFVSDVSFLADGKSFEQQPVNLFSSPFCSHMLCVARDFHSSVN